MDLDKRKNYLGRLALTLISLFLLAVFALSFKFEYSQIWPDKYVYWYVMLMCCAGVSFIFYIDRLDNSERKSPSLRIIFICGLSARLLFVPSEPILEDDFYRYFFDGSVVVHGHNPYRISPNEVQGIPSITDALSNRKLDFNGQAKYTDQGKPSLAYLKQEPLFERVAYPHVQSIYPPVAQFFFSLTSIISSFDIYIWRLILLAAELVTFWLLLKLLVLYRRPKFLIALYWLNPIVIIQGINSAHMDLLLVPFILSALYCLHKAKYKYSATLLALAVGIKLWPIVLAPIAAYQVYTRKKPSKKALVHFTMTFVGLTGMIILPQIIAFNYFSGLHQYSQFWQVNAFVFSVIESCLEYILYDANLSWFEDLNQMAKILTMVMFSLFVIYVTKPNRMVVKPRIANKSTCEVPFFCVGYQWLWVIFVLFILSPTGYPWYSIWFFPLLVLHFRVETRAMILLTATLPLYNLRYPEPSEAIFNSIIVPLTFAPVLVVLIWQQFKKHNKGVAAKQRIKINSL